MKKFLFLGIFVVLILLAPLGVKNLVDEEIEKQVSALRGNGIDLNILNSSGYLNTTREFELTIYNVEEFKEFLTFRLSQRYPAYEMFIKELLLKQNTGLDEFLEGIVFRGDIQNSNIDYNSDINSNIYLHSFSEMVMNEIKKDKDDKEFFLPFLEKKGLNLNILFSNKLVIKKAVLKDIDEIIFSTNNSGMKSNSKIKVLGYEVLNNSTSNAVKANIDLKKFFIDVEAKEKANVNLENLNYEIDYVNELINDSKLKVETLNFAVEDFLFSLRNLFLEGFGKVKNGLYTTSLILDSKDIKVNAKSNDTSINELAIDFDLKDLDYESLKKLNEAYFELEETALNQNLNKAQRRVESQKVFANITNSLNALVNKGAFLHGKLSLDMLENQIVNLNFLDINIDLILNKNNLDFLHMNKDAALEYIDGQIDIKLPKNDFDNLLAVIEPNLAILISLYAKEEKQNIVFNIAISKGKVNINDKLVN